MWPTSLLPFLERIFGRYQEGGVRRRKTPRHRAPRRQSFLPRLEILEDRTVPSGYQQINLVGELPGMAPHTDPNLDGWGMAATPNGYVVADPVFGVATFYDAQGTVSPQVVTIPPAPSQPLGPVGKPRGVEYNSTSEFVISEDGRSAPALVLFDSREGTISGWNPAVDPDHAIIMVDNSAELSTAYNHAMYSGLRIDQNSKGQNVLYAADRGHNRVDMFDGQFHFLGSFTDPNVSLQSLGHPGAWQVEDAGDGKLFVLFTMDLGPGGPFGGIVDIFDTDGHLLTPNHFAANAPGAGPLEDPWGLVRAPADFGPFSNDILIGNVEGPGYINAFDPATGAFLGHLTHPDGTPIAIPGLWDMNFGGGTPETGLTKQLYFDAGPTLQHPTGLGLFGRIIAAGKGDERGRSDDSTAGVGGSVSTLPGHGESGSVNVAAALPGAGQPAPAGIGTGASLAVAGELPDDLWPAVAAALTASSRPLALAPTVLTPENVERLDQLFAAGLAADLPLAPVWPGRHAPGRAADLGAALVVADSAAHGDPFPAVPWE